MAIPQSDPNSVAGDGANPAAPVNLPGGLSGSASTTPMPAPEPLTTPEPTPDAAPAPEPTPVAPTEPTTEPTDMGSDYKIEDAPADKPTSVVDLDDEMKMPEEEPAVAAADPVTEPPVDPNIALKNDKVKEGDLEPAPTMSVDSAMASTPEPVVTPEPTPEPVPAPTPAMADDNQIAAPTEVAPEKTTVNELPDLAAAAPEIADTPKTNESPETPAEPMHETPSQDKLKDIMAAKPEEPIKSDNSEMPVEQPAASADMKKPKGGSSMVMRLVLLFLLIGILAMSAVLAYLLFA